MYTVQKGTSILEVILEIRTMIVRTMKTTARTTVKRVAMMARLTPYYTVDHAVVCMSGEELDSEDKRLC
jgi:hypothetical protein